MKLRRLNIDFLGVYVSVNMDAETLLAAINLAVTNRPELQQVLGIYITVLQGLQQINIEINKLQMKDIELHRNIEFIINDSKYNKEVLEHFIDKLNKLNDSIKAKVDD